MVGVHVGVRAQGAGDDGAGGVRAGLVGRDLAGVHELLDVRVVMRHAHKRAVTQQVDARIAHMGDGHLSFLDEAARRGAPHAGLAHALLGAEHDGRVGGLHGDAQKDVVGACRSLLGDGADGNGARDLAGGVPAHAVAHGKQRCLHEERVLVVPADEANVGA